MKMPIFFVKKEGLMTGTLTYRKQRILLGLHEYIISY